MAKRLPDLGTYSAEETMDLALHALHELTQDQQIEVVMRLFKTAEAQAELAAHLEIDN